MAATRTQQSPSARRPRRSPVRTCAGCRAEVPQGELVRVVLGPEGEIVPDVAGSAFGRGAWLHPRPDCLEGAARGGLARSFRAQVTTSAPALATALADAASRRVEGLLSAARRAGQLAIGSEAVKEALIAGSALRVVVATDARAAAATPWVEEAVRAGRAAAWGSKDAIGRAVGRSEVGVVAVLDEGFANALSKVIEMAHVTAPSGSRNVRADVSTEVR